ncbi:MAG TPA: branched-chain amino acid ABC transporter permease [Candidatus Sulfomarinibacteraceae bacterium]|nr:branched-chain amino acid ABC transporter permease [Candidatus Sulfomarinibacteraceae bacterium]
MNHLLDHLRRPPVLATLGVAALMLVLPLVVQSYWLHVLIVAYFYAILASSWALLAGYGGQFSFGHMAFMAIGAYTTGLITSHLDIPLAGGIVLGSIAAGIAGWAIGALTLRFKAAYLALFTIAFSEILRTIIRAEPQITRGDRGLSVPPMFADTVSRIPAYYVMLGALFLSLLFMYWLAQSRVGLFLRAIREDEQAAAARGVDVVRYKVLTFVITSVLAGFAGAIFAHYITIITPNIMVIPQMGLVIAMAIIGGVESLIAAAIGAILIQVSLELLREFGPWRMVIFGGLLVITLRFARDGLLTGLFRRLFKTGPRAELREEMVEGAPADGA